jgi:hypothetical protein
MQHRIELLRQLRMKIMAAPFALREVDHPDRAFQAVLGQGLRRRNFSAQGQHETPDSGLVECLFNTVGQCRPNPLALGGRIPVRGRGHGAVIGGKADQEGLVAIHRARQLSDIPFALRTDLGGAGVADMRVMLPDHDLRGLAVGLFQVLRQHVQRVGHMPVAQVP